MPMAPMPLARLADTCCFALDGADVRQRFNELIEGLRAP
jgi:hypothetical protein